MNLSSLKWKVETSKDFSNTLISRRWESKPSFVVHLYLRDKDPLSFIYNEEKISVYHLKQMINQTKPIIANVILRCAQSTMYCESLVNKHHSFFKYHEIDTYKHWWEHWEQQDVVNFVLANNTTSFVADQKLLNALNVVYRRDRLFQYLVNRLLVSLLIGSSDTKLNIDLLAANLTLGLPEQRAQQPFELSFKTPKIIKMVGDGFQKPLTW